MRRGKLFVSWAAGVIFPVSCSIKILIIKKKAEHIFWINHKPIGEKCMHNIKGDI